MSNIPITLCGTVATVPQSKTLPNGRACSTFRLAVNHRHLDRSTGEFVDDGTSWFGVDCYGALAGNCALSLTQGMQVVVQGGLKIREWTSGDRSGRAPTVIADHLGPDLRYGTANYQRSGSNGGQPTGQMTQRSVEHESAPGWADLPNRSAYGAGTPAYGAEAMEPSDPAGRAPEAQPDGGYSHPVEENGDITEDDTGFGVETDEGAIEDTGAAGDAVEEDAVARATAAAAAPF